MTALAREFSDSSTSIWSQWKTPILLGMLLAITATWPVQFLRIGRFFEFLWQPLLLAVVISLTFWHRKTIGWKLAVGQNLWIYSIFTIAAWLPYLRTTHWEKAYPHVYGYYLYLYEIGIAAFIAYQAVRALSNRSDSWWNAGWWSRPLIVAPFLLIVRGIQVDHWVTVTIGVILGVAFGVIIPIYRWTKLRSFSYRVLPWVVFAIGFILSYGGSMRVYSQLGDRYPLASDDGPSYYQQAVDMSEEPSRFFTGGLHDQNFFTGYYALMGVWFAIVGSPHVPSWLLWHGLAGGLFALAIYWFGKRLVGPLFAAIAACMIIADHVILHLMSTMNMETFFLPAMYFTVLLWVKASEQSGSKKQKSAAFWAGIILGVATIFRPTSLLFGVALILALFVEKPRIRFRKIVFQSRWLGIGFFFPMALLYIRNRMAWGEWTLASTKSYLSLKENLAFIVDGQHLADVGVVKFMGLIAQDPTIIGGHIIPALWGQVLELWSHPGFGQMDLVRGLTHEGPYQAAFASVMSLCIIIGICAAFKRRTRSDVILFVFPAYFTALVIVFFVLNSRYRSPFIPVLYLLIFVGLSLARQSHQSQSSDLDVSTPPKPDSEVKRKPIPVLSSA